MESREERHSSAPGRGLPEGREDAGSRGWAGGSSGRRRGRGGGRGSGRRPYFPEKAAYLQPELALGHTRSLTHSHSFCRYPMSTALYSEIICVMAIINREKT